MGRVVVDAKRATGSDHAHIGHRRRAGVLLRMRLRVPDLHRRGVRPQVEVTPFVVLRVHVERVLHRARRMVVGVVERREAEPVGLDLGPVGDLEAERREDRLDPLEGATDGMQATSAARSAGQGHVERLGRELLLELGFGHRRATRDQSRVDRLLDGIDLGAARLLVIGRQRAESLQLRRDDAVPAEVARLGILELGRRRRRGEFGQGAFDHRLQIVHRGATGIRRLRAGQSPRFAARARFGFRTGAAAPSRRRLPNAAGS